MVKKSEYLERKNLKNHFFLQNKKNTLLLVLQNEEIGLQPELSSPLRFRIQGGGYPEPETEIRRERGSIAPRKVLRIRKVFALNILVTVIFGTCLENH